MTKRRSGGIDFYCSNRGRRGGCGHTYSVLLAKVLPRRQLYAPRLWLFISYLLRGLSRREAWRAAGVPFSLRHAYRVWRRILERRHEIAEALCRLRAPPPSEQREPILQLFEHLTGAFAPNDEDPITAFQLHFQRPFLG